MMDDMLIPVAVNRQRGLSTELSIIANNVANLATTGFRREGAVFAEYVAGTRDGGSVSIGDMNGRYVSRAPGPLNVTGRQLDLAIESEGFFVIRRGEREVLTRAGAFQVSHDGVLVTPSGEAVLDDGGAPILIPPEALPLVVAQDGTITGQDGPVARVAIVRPADGASVRAAGAAFLTDQAPEPLAEARVRQGALEGSNVEAVSEIARMIEVTRAYERAQALIEDQDERVRNLLETLGRAV